MAVATRAAPLFPPQQKRPEFTPNPSGSRSHGNRSETEESKLAANRTLTTVIYALYAASLLVGMTALVAIVINYIKKDDVVGTYLESHFRWQIRTFWYALLWAAIGVVTYVLLIGMLILFIDFVWFLYRIIRAGSTSTKTAPCMPSRTGAMRPA